MFTGTSGDVCNLGKSYEVFFIAKSTAETTLQRAWQSGKIGKLECRRGVTLNGKSKCALKNVRIQFFDNLDVRKNFLKIDGSNCNKWLLPITS